MLGGVPLSGPTIGTKPGFGTNASSIFQVSEKSEIFGTKEADASKNNFFKKNKNSIPLLAGIFGIGIKGSLKKWNFQMRPADGAGFKIFKAGDGILTQLDLNGNQFPSIKGTQPYRVLNPSCPLVDDVLRSQGSASSKLASYLENLRAISPGRLAVAGNISGTNAFEFENISTAADEIAEMMVRSKSSRLSKFLGKGGKFFGRFFKFLVPVMAVAAAWQGGTRIAEAQNLSGTSFGPPVRRQALDTVVDVGSTLWPEPVSATLLPEDMKEYLHQNAPFLDTTTATPLESFMVFSDFGKNFGSYVGDTHSDDIVDLGKNIAGQAQSDMRDVIDGEMSASTILPVNIAPIADFYAWLYRKLK